LLSARIQLQTCPFLVCSIVAERLCAPAHIKSGRVNSTPREETMGKLILQGDNFDLDFLVLSGTTTVRIASTGINTSINEIAQLAENDNVLTTVTISGSKFFELGQLNASNSGDGVDRHCRHGRIADHDPFFHRPRR
jgi:hypothetical protein